MLLGATSASLLSMDLKKFSAVSLMPSRTSLKRSVLAVHSTTTLSTPDDCLKSRMFCRTSSNCKGHHGRSYMHVAQLPHIRIVQSRYTDGEYWTVARTSPVVHPAPPFPPPTTHANRAKYTLHKCKP